MISVEQRFVVLARLGEHIDWDSLSTEQVQVGVTEAKRAGNEVTLFIRNGFRMLIGTFFRETGECRVAIPALPRLSLAELKEKFPWVEKIHRDVSPEGPVTLTLGTVLAEGESSVSGVEYERRLISVEGPLGPQHVLWLVLHQNEYPAFKALLGKVYIDFPGLIAVDGDGDRRFAYLDQDGERWTIHWRWVDGVLDSDGRIAVGKPAEVG